MMEPNQAPRTRTSAVVDQGPGKHIFRFTNGVSARKWIIASNGFEPYALTETIGGQISFRSDASTCWCKRSKKHRTHANAQRGGWVRTAAHEHATVCRDPPWASAATSATWQRWLLLEK